MNYADADHVLMQKRLGQYRDYCFKFNENFRVAENAPRASFLSVTDIHVPTHDIEDMATPLPELSQSDKFDETADAASKENTTSQSKEFGFYNRWVILLNSSAASVFKNGLTDFHRDSWIVFLNTTKPFKGIELKSEVDKTCMSSVEELKSRNLLMPFDDERYNMTWKGINPSTEAEYPHDKHAVHDFFKHEKLLKTTKGINKINGSSGVSAGLDKMANSLSEFVAFKSGSGVAITAATHILLKRIYPLDSGVSNFDVHGVIDKTIDQTLSSFVSRTVLGDEIFGRFWNLGTFDPDEENKTWEIKFTIELTGERTLILSFDEAKQKTILQILSDPFTRTPLVCSVNIVEKAKLTGQVLKFF